MSEFTFALPGVVFKDMVFQQGMWEEKTPQSQVQDHSALYPSRPLRNLTET